MALCFTRSDTDTLKIRCQGCRGSATISRQDIDDLFAGKKEAIKVRLLSYGPPSATDESGANYMNFKLDLDNKQLRTRLTKALGAERAKPLVVKGVAMGKVPSASRRGAR
jgi:hypothetical protein